MDDARFDGTLPFVTVLFVAVGLRAGDWPQYRGPTHDGICAEVIRTNWTAAPPRPLWKIPLDPGLSSFTVSGSKAFTQVRRTIGGQTQEVCIALNADTGQELWATPLDTASYPDGGVGSDDGPRSTPSVDGNFIYVLTSYLKLACLQVGDGHVVWTNDLVAAYGGTVIAWQNAASPLIENGLIFVNGNAPNQRLLALHESDGSGAWKGQDDPMTQASPIIATIAGSRQVVFFTQSGLVSVAPATGSVLWRYPLPFAIATAASPVVGNDTVYGSAAYGVGAGAVQITSSGGTGLATNPLWRTPGANMNHWATPVFHDGYLYGVYGQAGDTTTLRCLELATGTERWRQPGVGLGGVLFTTGLVLVSTEDGYLLLVNPDPSGYMEAARYQALDGSSSSIAGLPVKCWNVPAISNGRIYWRSTTEAVCLDVAAVAPPPPLKLSGAFAAGGSFRLLVANQDNSPVDANRATNIDVLVSTDLTLGLTGWTRLVDPFAVTNGELVLDDPPGANAPRRFYRTEEHP